MGIEICTRFKYNTRKVPLFMNRQQLRGCGCVKNEDGRQAEGPYKEEG